MTERSPTTCEALLLTKQWLAKNFGNEKEPMIRPAATASDAIERFTSIHSQAVAWHPNVISTLVIGSARAVHFLGLIKELKGSYADGDSLFPRRIFRAFCLAPIIAAHLFLLHSAPDVEVGYAENGYKQILAKVVSKFGPESPYAATALEQLAMFEDSQPGWAYAKACEPGVSTP